MALFGKGNGGGLMNVIRCDEMDYLVWKWRPQGQAANSTTRENSIRYGSSLRVKDGEVAVFVYRRQDGSVQDFIEGPYDDTIKTANFPVLSSIVGLGFGGESPFQAEVYFINLAGNIKMDFGVPFFDVSDPRLMDSAVPVSAGGSMTFNITDYKGFIKLNRLVNFEMNDFKARVKDVVNRRVKNVISNAPSDFGFPLVQIERKIDEINDKIKERLQEDFTDFGITLKRLDLSRITPDKESLGWRELRALTYDTQAQTIKAQTEIGIKNMKDMQEMNATNMAESLRIQREESQRAQKLQTETNYLGAHAINQQANVLKAGAQSLGQMGNMGGSGMNPAGMMTGMMMGGAMGHQMAGMMNNMGQNMMNTPPPMPQIAYYMAVNGQQQGPFNMQQLQQMVQSGQLTKQSYLWKQGMAQWQEAGNIAELATLFAPAMPAGVPPMPGGGAPPMPGGGAPPMP